MTILVIELNLINIRQEFIMEGLEMGSFTCIFNKLHLWLLCLINPVEFKQALSTHELYHWKVTHIC